MPQAFNETCIFRIQPVKRGSLCPGWALAQLGWAASGAAVGLLKAAPAAEAKAKDHQGKGIPWPRRKVAKSGGGSKGRGRHFWVPS